MNRTYFNNTISLIIIVYSIYCFNFMQEGDKQ